jgi:hypothetical protein
MWKRHISIQDAASNVLVFGFVMTHCKYLVLKKCSNPCKIWATVNGMYYSIPNLNMW